MLLDWWRAMKCHLFAPTEKMDLIMKYWVFLIPLKHYKPDISSQDLRESK